VYRVWLLYTTHTLRFADEVIKLSRLNFRSLNIYVFKLLVRRAKWETLRLHQSMRHVEADVRRQYVDKMAEQRAQLELEMNKST
jgi:hypothetical protein